MATQTGLITAEQLAANYADQRCELVNGEVLTMAPASYGHGQYSLEMGRLLGNYVNKHKLGRVYGAETGFILRRDPDTVRAPDAAFVRAERVLPPGDGFFDGAPDLAVEVVSPRDTRTAVQEKVDDYLAAGTRLVWVIWPETRSVTAHTPDGQRRILHEGDNLDGADVLPGFTCPVAAIFE